jgi:hypothetical protein
LAERLQHLADHPEQKAEMGQRALAKVGISTVRKSCRLSTQLPTPWTVPDAQLWAEIKIRARGKKARRVPIHAAGQARIT